MSRTLIDRHEISIGATRATKHRSLVFATLRDEHAAYGDQFNAFDGTMDRVEVTDSPRRNRSVVWKVVLTYFVSSDLDTQQTVGFVASTQREAALGAVACLPRSAIGRGRAKSERAARDRAAADLAADARMAAAAAEWKPPRRGLQLDAEDARAAGTPATAVDAVAEGLRMWHGLR